MIISPLVAMSSRWTMSGPVALGIFPPHQGIDRWLGCVLTRHREQSCWLVDYGQLAVFVERSHLQVSAIGCLLSVDADSRCRALMAAASNGGWACTCRCRQDRTAGDGEFPPSDFLPTRTSPSAEACNRAGKHIAAVSVRSTRHFRLAAPSSGRLFCSLLSWLADNP